MDGVIKDMGIVTKRKYIIIIAILIIIGGVLINMLIIGKVKDISSVDVSEIEVTDTYVSANVHFATSADVMNSYTYRIENDVLYIKIKSVLIGGLKKSSINIKGDFSLLQKIVLEDKEKQRIIWEK